MNNLETIKNISLFFVSIIVFVGLIYFYIKIIFNYKKIKEINKKIEETQVNLDLEEINNIEGFREIDIDFTGDKQKYKKWLEQSIKKLQREKIYLLEEISIFKIFKK